MKKLKKPTAAMLIATMIFANSQTLLVSANEIEKIDTKIEKSENKEEKTDSKEEKSADVEAPVVDISSLKVDKKEATVGDRIKFSIKVTEDSEMRYAWIRYNRPLTGDTQAIYLNYNQESGLYEGYLDIDENVQSGDWKIDAIHFEDTYDNSILIGNSNTGGYGDVSEDLSSGDFKVSGTNADLESPIVDLSTLKIDKKDVTIGDRVKVSVKVTDDSQIEDSWLTYYKPITGDRERIYLTHNQETGLYEGYLDIDNNTQSGDWKIDRIHITDVHDNFTDIYNSNTNTYGDVLADLSVGDFKVSGTNADIEAPIVHIDTLKIDKKEAIQGEKVKLSIKVTEQSGMDRATIMYSKPTTGNPEAIYLNHNPETDLYEGYLEIDENTELGDWKIDFMSFKDVYDNEIYIHNSNTNEFAEVLKDLSAGDFKAIEDTNLVKPIEGATVINSSQTWTNKTINGDLYIGKDAVLTVNGNVQVTGNVYVLGALRTYGGLSVYGTVNGTSMHMGGNPTLYNGTVVLSGSNHIASTSITNNPISDIPVRIDNSPLVATDGILDINGATLDVAKMYIEGKEKDIEVELDHKGRFDVKALDIGQKEKLTIKFETIFENTIVKEYDITHKITPPLVDLNNVPQITANDVEIKTGEKFEPLSIVTANDKEDGDITKNIKVVSSNVNTEKPGIYQVTYKVTDSQGASKTKTITVTVVQGLVGMNTVPQIEASDVEIKVGEEFDPLTVATASDKEDGDITKDIKVLSSTVDTSKAGTYEVTYKVTDSQGASTTKAISVKVVQGLVGMNTVPQIEANDVEIEVGEEFNPLTVATASDKEDGDITKDIKVLLSTVDTSKAGTYEVTYKVTDSQGASTTKTISVSVVQGLIGMNTVPQIEASDVEIKVGEEFDPLTVATASDKEDGDITKDIKVISSTVDTSKAGTYEVTYKVTDSQGASTTKTISVKVVQGLVGMNTVPQIEASDVEIKVGEEFDPLTVATASDKEDGDITKDIKVLSITVDTSKEGTYEVTYKVTDSQGASTTKTISVKVVQGLVGMNTVPQIEASDVEIKVGEEFDPLTVATASDKEDGDITKDIKVLSSTVDTSKEGTYEVTYKVTDSQGASTAKTISVKVVQGLIGMNTVPQIEASDVQVKLGEEFDALSIVKATDKEDGDITSKIEILTNTVDTSKEGTYEVTYKVTDSMGASITKTIKVEVVQGLIEMNHVPQIEAEDVKIKLGEEFDALSIVKATDKEDGDITSEIEILTNTVDTSKIGTYEVTYKVTDSDGASVIKTIKVEVVKELIDGDIDEDKDDDKEDDKDNDKTPDKDNPQTGDAGVLGYTLLGSLSLGALFTRNRRRNKK